MSAFYQPPEEPDLGSDEWEKFRSWAMAFGVSLSARELRLLKILFEELWAWNRKMNLTGLPTRERILKELILDSLIPHACLPATRRLLDVGTGAGFPGIPLKICRPSITLHLVESSSKKVGFLRHVIRRTALEGVTVFHVRMEEAAPLLDAEGYPLVTARAVAPLPTIIPWCAPHVSDGGLLVGFQGDRIREVLRKAQGAMEKHGLKLREVIPYTLPGKGSPRHMVLLQKVAAGN